MPKLSKNVHILKVLMTINEKILKFRLKQKIMTIVTNVMRSIKFNLLKIYFSKV